MARVYAQRNIGSFVRFNIPEIFSIIENPDETISALIQFRKAIAQGRIKTVYVDYAKCDQLDLCASVLLDVLAMRAKKQRAFRNSKLRIQGNFSQKPEIDIMLASSGILKHLGSDVSRNLDPELLKSLRFSELQQGCPSPPNMTSSIEIAASDLADFSINACERKGIS